MKKIIPLLLGVVLGYSVSAQDWVDALRFSESFAGGTARATAMGGAFGALGADFYSASQNPAGLGFYRRSEIVITPELYYSKIKSNYLSNNTQDSRYNLNLNNFGYINAFKPKNDKILSGLSFAIGFNRINNFSSYSIIQGENNDNSLAEHYVELANYDGGLDAFSSDLFYQAFVIDQDTTDYSFYISNDKFPLPGIQRKIIDRSGRINEWNLALGFNFDNLIYFGTAFNILPLYYSETSNYSEYDAFDPSYQYFNFRQEAITSGTGYAGKFGIIVVPVQMLHIGLAFHTPVWYNLNYSYLPSIKSPYTYGSYLYPYNYEGGLSIDYTLKTPYKLVGSLGVIFGKIGLVNIDVEYIDYTSMNLRSEDALDDLNDMNQEIENRYCKTINLKTGAEVRAGVYYFRGGFGYYGSPYKSNIQSDIFEVGYSTGDKNSYHLSYSAGLGMRLKHFSIDFGWSYLTQHEKDVLYDFVNASSTNVSYSSDLDKNSMKIMTTIGFRF